MTAQCHTRRLLCATTLVAVLAMAGGCGRFYQNDVVQDDPAAVIFTNQSLDPADIYVVESGLTTTRLGSVMAGRTDTLIVPRQIVQRGGSVNIIARMLARSYTPQTGAISIRAGDVLDVRLDLDARLLSVVPARP